MSHVLDSDGQGKDSSFETIFAGCKGSAIVHASGVSDYIKIGSEYQADIPELSLKNGKEDKEFTPEKCLKVWSPSKELPDSEIDHFIKDAYSKYGYSHEQALGVLYWNKMYVEASIEDLKEYEPKIDSWSQNEQEAFEAALRMHKKDFSRINQVFPDQTLKSIVENYYR